MSMKLISLPAYTAISVALAAIAVSYTLQKVSNISTDHTDKSGTISSDFLNGDRQEDYLLVVLSAIFREKLCVLALVNLAYTALVWIARLLQTLFFGELRVIESQHMYDRLLNYLIFKILFVGAVLEPDLKELVVWATWFSMIGFLRVFSMLARDRFEYLSFSPTTPLRVHARILSLLMFIQALNIFWLAICVYVFAPAGWSVVFLLAFECVTLFMDTMQTTVKYGIHLYDIHHEGQWEDRGTIAYYTEFITDTFVLLATLIHYIHVMILHGVGFTLIDAVLFLNMRTVYASLKKKIQGFVNYRTAARNLDTRYPTASPEEVKQFADSCAICRDDMTSAKRLPCGHMFHLSCLRSWVEHHGSCPTCRHSLLVSDAIETSNSNATANTDRDDRDTDNGPPVERDTAMNNAFGAESATAQVLGVGLMPPEQRANDEYAYQTIIPEDRLFRFPFATPNTPNTDDTPLPPNEQALVRPGGIFGWLASMAGASNRQPPAQEMVDRVAEMFPHIPRAAIVTDLTNTGSVEVTTENILEGRFDLTIRDPQPPPSDAPIDENTIATTEAQLSERIRTESVLEAEISVVNESIATLSNSMATTLETEQETDTTLIDEEISIEPIATTASRAKERYSDTELNRYIPRVAAGPTIGTDHILWSHKKTMTERARSRYIDRHPPVSVDASDAANIPDENLFQILDRSNSE